MASVITKTPSLPSLGAMSATASYVWTPEFLALGVEDLTLFAQGVKTPQLPVLAVITTVQDPEHVTKTSQFPTLAVYNVGSTEDFRLRAWGFTMDGHRFYVLHIGEQGTFVYDFVTQQWSEWKTEGYTTGWNAHLGLNWAATDLIVAADKETSDMWIIDAETFRDAGYKDITRVVTAIIPQTGWSWRSHDSLQLIMSLGVPSATPGTVTMTFSDDQGKTFNTYADASITINPLDYTQEIDWSSLGSFKTPGRIINITDLGGMGRIDRAAYEAT